MASDGMAGFACADDYYVVQHAHRERTVDMGHCLPAVCSPCGMALKIIITEIHELFLFVPAQGFQVVFARIPKFLRNRIIPNS